MGYTIAVSCSKILMGTDNCTSLATDHCSPETSFVSSPSAFMHALSVNQLTMDLFHEHTVLTHVLAG